MADGKVVVETGLDTTGIEKDLKQAEKQVEQSGKKMKVSFEDLSKQSGKSVEAIKLQAKGIAEEYQKQGMSIPNAYKKAYSDMGVYSDRAAQKMKSSAEAVEDKFENSAKSVANEWEDTFDDTKQESKTAKNKLESDAKQESQAHQEAGAKSAQAWTESFDKIKSLASAAVKTTAAIITGITTALAGVGGYAIKVGSDFEAAMSKVGAISGASASEIDKLTQKAKEMGATTQFSATESAEAFQYMAMAGWKTEDMISGISGIMNLAAADGLDLATTSDIVTDALTAFGLTAEDSGHFADVLATASSNANTNVFMLGESFKYVAPVAGAMNYSVEDVSKALGLMANSSVKGSMAGTSLKTALSNLASPTDAMKAAMDKYGISLTDSTGNMKSLDDVMLNLRSSLGGLSEQEQTAAASTIFGKEAMAGMLAVVNASESDYDKLSESIAKADGTAENMAKTMNDNLKGKITLAKSAAEGFGIQVYESIEGSLKEAVETGTDYIGQLSDAMTDGGLEAAVEKGGDIVAQLAVKIAQAAPDMVEASISLMKSFAKGIADNKHQLQQATKEIVNTMCDGLISLLPKKTQEPAKKAMDSLKKTFESGTKNVLKIGKSTIEVLGKIFEKLADNMDTVAPVVITLVAAFKTFKAVSGPVQTVVSVVTKLSAVSSETGIAVGALNAVMSANPAVLIAGGIAVLVGGLAAYIATSDKADESQTIFNDKMDELSVSIEKNQQNLDDLKESMENTSSSIETSSAPLENWQDQLNDCFDSTGKVKEGCEDMANYILEQLNDAMGTQYTLTADGFITNNEGVQQSLDEVNQTIDAYVQKLKQKSLQEATANQYTEALQNQSDAVSTLDEAQRAYNDALDAYTEVYKTHENAMGDVAGIQKAYDNLDKAKEKLGEASQAAVDAGVEVNGLDSVMSKLAEGTPESVGEALDMYSKIPVEARNAAEGVATSQTVIQGALSSTDYSAMTEGFRLAVEQIEASGGDIPESLGTSIQEAMSKFKKMGPEGQEHMRASMGMMMEGMREKIPEFSDASRMTSEQIIDTFNSYLVDSGALNGTGSEAIGELSSGIIASTPSATSAASDVVNNTVETTKQTAAEGKAQTTEAGSELMSGVSEGAGAVDTTTVPAQKAQEATASITSEFASGAGEVQQATAALGDSAKSGIESSDLAGTFQNQGSTAGSEFSNSISSQSGTVSSAVASFGKASGNALKGVNLTSNFQSQAKNAVTAFCAAIRGQISAASSASRDLGTSVAKALIGCNLSTTATTQGHLFGSGFISGINGQQGNASTAGRFLGAAAQKALNGYAGVGHGIGVQFSSGFANGIRSGQNGVAAAAAAVANAAANAAKANLDIHSPSRVGEYIGAMFDKGIEGGTEKNAAGIERAVKGVTDVMKIDPAALLSRMRGAFTSGINRIADSQVIVSAATNHNDAHNNELYRGLADYLLRGFARVMDGQETVCEWNGREMMRMIKEVMPT